jgi:hypothetical protein
MKRLLLLLFAGLMVVGLAGKPAGASTFDLGVITPGDHETGFVANFGTGIVSFEDTIKFSLTAISTSLIGKIRDSLAFSYLNLAAGDYFFRVMGDTGPTGNIYKYRFTAGTEVPLPPALLLFATAVGGLGLFGYRRRKLES